MLVVERSEGYPAARQERPLSVYLLNSMDPDVGLSPMAQQMMASRSDFLSVKEGMTDEEGSVPPTAGRMDSGVEETEEAMPERPAYSAAADFERMDSVTASAVEEKPEGPAAEAESVPLDTPVLPVLRYADELAWAVEGEEVLGTSIMWVDPHEAWMAKKERLHITWRWMQAAHS